MTAAFAKEALGEMRTPADVFAVQFQGWLSLQLHMALIPGLVSGVKHSSLVSEEGELGPADLCVMLGNYRTGSGL